MIISDSLTYGDVFGTLERVTRSVARKINPTVYTPAEFFKAGPDGKRVRDASARAAETLGDWIRR
jgi:hypothetical protein